MLRPEALLVTQTGVFKIGEELQLRAFCRDDSLESWTSLHVEVDYCDSQSNHISA